MIIIDNKKEQKHTATMMPASKVRQASFLVKEEEAVITVSAPEEIAVVEEAKFEEVVVESSTVSTVVSEASVVLGDTVVAEVAPIVVSVAAPIVAEIKDEKAPKASLTGKDKKKEEKKK